MVDTPGNAVGGSLRGSSDEDDQPDTQGAPDVDAIAQEIGRIRAASGGTAARPLMPVVQAIEQLIDAQRMLHAEERMLRDALEQARQQTACLRDQLQGLLRVARGMAAGRASGQDPPAQRASFDQPRFVAAGARPDVPEPQSMTQPPVLTARVLGPFHVQVNAQTIDTWPTCRARSIFEYLLLHRRQPVPKDLLMDVLWPDGEPEARRNSLNVAVHRLRRLLARFDADFAFVPFANGCYALNPELVVQTDADAYLEHARRAATLDGQGQRDAARTEYESCRALYRQELLAQNRGDEWVVRLRQQWRDRHLAVLRWLSRHAMAAGEFAECAQLCSEILAIDPCHEEAHRELMRAYAALGQPEQVQNQYRNCVRVLARDLGIPVSAETTALYREIARSSDAA